MPLELDDLASRAAPECCARKIVAMLVRKISELAAPIQMQQAGGEDLPDSLMIVGVELKQLVVVLDRHIVASRVPKASC